MAAWRRSGVAALGRHAAVARGLGGAQAIGRAGQQNMTSSSTLRERRNCDAGQAAAMVAVAMAAAAMAAAAMAMAMAAMAAAAMAMPAMAVAAMAMAVAATAAD